MYYVIIYMIISSWNTKWISSHSSLCRWDSFIVQFMRMTKLPYCHYNVIQTKPKSSRWQSRASPAERCTRFHRGRTCWTPTWASAPACPVTSRSARRWTHGNRSCRLSLRRTCETRARRTWTRRRTERSYLRGAEIAMKYYHSVIFGPDL